MHYAAQPAFVLHARPYRETSLLLELLSRDHGRVGLVARGVRGPKRQVLSLIHIALPTICSV